MSSSPQLVEKLWNYCNILSDDGVDYGGALLKPACDLMRKESRKG